MEFEIDVYVKSAILKDCSKFFFSCWYDARWQCIGLKDEINDNVFYVDCFDFV